MRRPVSIGAQNTYAMHPRFLFLAAALAASPAFPQTTPAPLAKPLAEIALHPERDASAQAVALNESRIAAEISANILALPVEVGQTIARGTVLARLDCRDHELALARARAAHDAARSRLALSDQQLRRARELGSKGFFSKEALDARATELDVVRADTAQARAQLATAERAVGKCVVRAPFRAIVRQRLANVGELAAAGTPLVALADADRVEVAAQIQPADRDSLGRAEDVRFVGDGGTRRLKLTRVSPAIDPQARTVEARLVFVDKPAPPGAAGRIVWRDLRPYLPAEILVRRDGRLGVFLEEAGVARFHALPQAQEGRPALAELPAAARIFVRGHLGLKDGQRIAGSSP